MVEFTNNLYKTFSLESNHLLAIFPNLQDFVLNSLKKNFFNYLI